MSDPYVTPKGIEIHNPKPQVFTTTSAKTGKTTERYQLKGHIVKEDGSESVKVTFVKKEVALEYGKPKRFTAKPAKKKKSCKEKYDECETKKKSASKKKAAPKKTKKVESDEEESEEREDASAEEREEEEDEESERTPTPVKKRSPKKPAPKKPKAPKKPAAKGRGKK